MLWLTVLVVWCSSDCVRGTELVRNKPFYPPTTHAHLFAEFKAMYHKQYTTPEEERHRFNAFKKNLATINELNAVDKHAWYDVNEEGDLTGDEIEAKYKDINVGSRGEGSIKIFPPKNDHATSPVPDSFDWRDRGVVPKPRDQKNCNASWALSAVACIETHHAIRRKEHVSFSAQQAIDCDERNKGCEGGDPGDACLYYFNKGLMKEEDYKYVGAHSKCAYNHEKVVAYIYACMIPAYPEEIADQALRQAPLTALIDSRPFQWYRGGIITTCAFQGYNHAVLLTGYGHENGVQYWSLQNSKGESWGENGYARIRRGVHCLGIAGDYTLTAMPLKNDTAMFENIKH